MEEKKSIIMIIKFGDRFLTSEEYRRELSQLERLNELPSEYNGCAHRMVDASGRYIYNVTEFNAFGWETEDMAGGGSNLGRVCYNSKTLKVIKREPTNLIQGS